MSGVRTVDDCQCSTGVRRIGRRVAQRMENSKFDIGEVDELASVAAGPESRQRARVGDRIIEYEPAGPARLVGNGSPLAWVMSTTPSPTSAVPPLTTPTIAIVLLAPRANSVPELMTVPLTITVPPVAVSTVAPLPTVPPLRFNCVPLVTSTSQPDPIVPPWITLVPLIVSITALLPFACSLPPEIFARSSRAL